CHLGMPSIGARQIPPPLPPHIIQEFERRQLEEQARVAAFGEIRPVIQVPDYAGYRFVAVRNRLYFEKKEKWKFFTDFLLHYGLAIFGQEWLDQQNAAAPANQHPAYIWRKQAYVFMRNQKPLAEGVYASAPNGATSAILNFYYDLYTVDDNSLLDDVL